MNQQLNNPISKRTSGVPLIDIAAKHSEIARHADRAALERMMDPSNYLGQAGPMIGRVLATHT